MRILMLTQFYSPMITGKRKVRAFQANTVVTRIDQIYQELTYKEQVNYVGQHHYQQL